MLTCSVQLPGTDSPDPNLDVCDLLRAWIRVWARWLLRHPNFPKLYVSGVRYAPEDKEVWQSPPTTLQLGRGDCEDLTLWRCAELVASGEQVVPRCVGRVGPLGGMVQHVFLRRQNGGDEDPSLILLPKVVSHGKR